MRAPLINVGVMVLVAIILAVGSAPDFGAYYEQFPNCDPTGADINADDVVNAYDIDPFIALIAGG
ncbi:MAG: hypothetical protein KJ749_06940 [Planctomycetes bacterium]|nr:hypothetical protein [Planctomycetota bacterium]